MTLSKTMERILLTTTSFQDTPGPHHDLLADSGYEVVCERGPLSEAKMLELSGDFDAFLCGDDAITRAVIEKSLPRLRLIAKYGIGLDKIDVAAATEHGIPVTFTPGVNHTSVAEHVFALLLGLVKNLIDQAVDCRNGLWKRRVGTEIFQKKIGIIGLGRVGKEVAVRAKAFGMSVCAYDVYWDEAFATAHGVERCDSVKELLAQSDIVSLHTNLSPETQEMINKETLACFKDGAYLINCGRGELINTTDVIQALEDEKLAGYGADVLDEEPPSPDHPLLHAPNALITPHVGSRVTESVQRQADMALRNLLLVLEGKAPLAQANKL